MYKYSKKLLNKIESFDFIQFTELFFLISGTKKSVLWSLNESEIKIIKNLVPYLFFCHEKIKNRSNKIQCAISFDYSIAKELNHSFLHNNAKKVGQILGYPDCCNHFWRNNASLLSKKDLILTISENANNKNSYLLNNILNYHSRLEAKDLNKKYHLSKKKIRSLDCYQFISHVPCSYACKESIKIAKENYSVIKKFFPSFSIKVKTALCNIYLFFDLFEWIIFKGIIDNDIVHYDKIENPKSLINKKLLDKFKLGNKFIVSLKKIIILNNDSVIHVIHKKNKNDGRIINFTS